MTDPVLLIGRVVEVTGSRVIGELEASVENLYRTYQSRRYAVGQVGSIVKIEAGDQLVFGLVTSLRMVETEDPEQPFRQDVKWITMDLLGEGLRTGLAEGAFEFRRGVHTYPLPGHRIFIATAAELRQVYSPPDLPSFRAGVLSQASSIPVYLQTDELLTKHFAVLGTTGAGKSCAIALLLHSLVKSCQNSHIVILDLHDEYTEAFKELAEPFDPTDLELPHWLLNLEESIGLFIGKTEYVATSQANILKAAILEARKRFAMEAGYDGLLTVDTPVPYRISDLVETIESAKPATGGAAKQEPYEKILSKIDLLIKDDRFSFLVRRDDDIKDNMGDIMSHILRTPVDGRPVSVIDLSGVPSDVVDVLVSLLARLIFDFAVWTSRSEIMPILLVCEEAHRYIPRSDEAAFEPARNSLGRIAKEGRKYGVSLGLVTQRPSELSDAALSQCNTIIALRMANEQDQNFVRRALPDTVASLVDALPALRTQEGVIAGQGVTVPVRLLFDTLPKEQRPHSHDVPFSLRWQDDAYDQAFVDGVIERWRNQVRQ